MYHLFLIHLINFIPQLTNIFLLANNGNLSPMISSAYKKDKDEADRTKI